jgi:FtsP/CotA-like multicopper oxidase with cupredoxin domain
VFILTFGGLVAVVVLVSLLRSFFHNRGDGSSHDFRRGTDDYILGPDWDYNASPQVREFNWTIREIIGNPDGVYRPLLTINGKFPGELIRCNEGDTIVVNVENKGVNATSIHWHGLYQNGTNWMDGTPGITQCPIAPGGSFRYEFTVKGQSGTCELLSTHGMHWKSMLTRMQISIMDTKARKLWMVW